MNEKIKEIAKKAGITFKPMMIDGEEYSYQHVHLNDYTKGVEDEAGCIKLFAELLIKECINIGEKISKEEFEKSKKPGDIFEYKSHAAQDVVDSIKEHFDLE